MPSLALSSGRGLPAPLALRLSLATLPGGSTTSCCPAACGISDSLALPPLPSPPSLCQGEPNSIHPVPCSIAKHANRADAIHASATTGARDGRQALGSPLGSGQCPGAQYRRRGQGSTHGIQTAPQSPGRTGRLMVPSPRPAWDPVSPRDLSVLVLVIQNKVRHKAIWAGGRKAPGQSPSKG